MLLYMYGSFHINIQYRSFTLVPDSFELSFQGSIIFSLVHDLPFNKCVFINLIPEFSFADKIIIYSVLFFTPGFAGCRRNRKGKIGVFVQQVMRNRSFTRSGWSSNDNNFFMGCWHEQNLRQINNLILSRHKIIGPNRSRLFSIPMEYFFSLV